VWNVILVDEVDQWFVDLCATDQDLAEAVTAAIDMLEHVGPSLGRPLVDDRYDQWLAAQQTEEG
jgi:hypothetical protein